MSKRVRYVLEEGIQAATRKSEVPVVLEIEGLTRKHLVQLQAAIHQELTRREESWKQQRMLISPFGQEQPLEESQQDCPAA